MNKFIVIEGLDGSGKTTITKLLRNRFVENDLPCIGSFAPTNNHFGRMMRSILSEEIKNVENESIALLLAADRYQHLKEEILPALENSHLVCDRFYYSSMAYQGVDDATLARIITYNQATMDIKRPDMVFFLNVSPEECMRRIAKRAGEANIFDGLQALTQCEARYNAAFATLGDKENVIKIGNDQSTLEEIVEEIWVILNGQI